MKNLITTSKIIAILSFIIGTILFVLQLYFGRSVNLISTGILFIVIAAIINAISFIALIIALFNYYNLRLEIFKTIGIVLVNIPVTILYFLLLLDSL